jgi:hypothetical protein
MPTLPNQGRLIIAGATGVLGNEVLQRLVGLQLFSETRVLAREPIMAGLRGVHTQMVAGDAPSQWPPLQGHTAVVMFDPPRLFYQRERALWTPRPEDLPELARWLRAGGVSTLAIVMPHTQMRLPEALKRGLASLDEHEVAQLGFDRLLIVRTARKPGAQEGGHFFERLARWMLGTLKYMVPTSEQPVRAVKVAEFVVHALRLAPPGIHVAAPETVWQAAQADVGLAVAAWLRA